MTVARIRSTSNNKLVAGLRLAIAVLFLMTGAMKLLVPCSQMPGRVVRLAGLMVIGIMTVATYVHLVVDDPALFPLQPSAPAIPVVVLALSAYLIWRGAGAWSLDLRSSRTAV